ncbi:uncharacterized protein [Chelonus insularis]|uniref:uncharacterized protein n=1 Tax=Chelonus insularis TaxID=460826 RepID=UPI00158E99F9|nr:uncharacterized protein LOC118074184 [Chelonus insularis]XP_034951085.1 uncharacterized protein LOC118074184 [Chelonus insularis]
MVKKRGVVWSYYDKKVEGSTVIAFCKFCHRSYIQNATRMEKHLARCEKAAPDVKQLFLRVSTSKRVNRARLLGAKIGGDWINKNGEITLDISNLTEADIEDINEWNRQKEEMANNEDVPVQSLDLLEEDDDPAGWSGQQESSPSKLQRKNTESMKTHREWIKEDDLETVTVDNYETTEEEPQLQNVNVEQGRVSVNPLLQSVQTIPASPHSPLQTKILQEQLLERRAFRKIAELELRRKTLEFERFQWEYEHEKARAEKQWAHELRMMQLKEERERVIVQRDMEIAE